MHEQVLFQQEKINQNKKEQKIIQAEDYNIITLFGLIEPQLNQTLKPNFVNDFKYVAKDIILSGHIEEKRKKEMVKQNRTYNHNQIISITLSSCTFVNLKELQLDMSGIVTIEFIGFLDAVNLKKLFLNQNHITNFNAFNKTNFNQFRSLYVGKNPSGTAIKFQRMKSYHILFNVLLQRYQDYNVMMEDLCHLVKLQCSFIQFLYVRNQNRINQKKIHQKLKQKYRNNNYWGEMQEICILQHQN